MDFTKQRTRVTLQEHCVSNTRSTDFPGSYYGIDDSWSFDKFKKNFRIENVNFKCDSSELCKGKELCRDSKWCKSKDLCKGKELEFDMIGIDASIANAFRRILISEIPTMAIEKVFLYNNTCIIQDEVLCHRLGLIPIRADPKMFEYRSEGDADGTPEDTIEFKLQIKCSRNAGAPPNASTPEEAFKNHLVYSKHLEWVPLGSQASCHGEKGIGVLHDNILLAKLRPGHEIDLRVQCVKGIGYDHAKFSPVATATYRLLPEIILKKPVFGEAAKRLQTCFSPGVIELCGAEGAEIASIGEARKDTGSRNHMRHDDLKDAVEINRIRNHFIFSVESVSFMSADQLVTESIKILMGKCETWLGKLEKNEIPFVKEK